MAAVVGSYYAILTGGSGESGSELPDYYEVMTRGHYAASLPYRFSGMIKHYMSLNYGDKIKIVAKTTNGNTVNTTSETVRIRIRKKQQ